MTSALGGVTGREGIVEELQRAREATRRSFAYLGKAAGRGAQAAAKPAILFAFRLLVLVPG